MRCNHISSIVAQISETSDLLNGWSQLEVLEMNLPNRIPELQQSLYHILIWDEINKEGQPFHQLGNFSSTILPNILPLSLEARVDVYHHLSVGGV